MTVSAPPARVERRRIDGVLLLDKAQGLSSNQALGRVKYLFRALKAGHSGTLDPMATGLLPIFLGEATKFSQHGLDADKEYEATVMLGITTTTGDVEGDVISQKPVNVSAAEAKELVTNLKGEQDQMPPMFSALKYQGRPLYDYARRGIQVERKPRPISIYESELLNYEPPVLRMRVACSKGTYIRSLAETLGERAGCGAHLIGLRRTRAAKLHIDQAVTLERLSQMGSEALMKQLLPVDYLLQEWPCLHLSQAQAQKFRHGQAVPFSAHSGVSINTAQHAKPMNVMNPNDNFQSGALRVYSDTKEFLGIASCKAGLLQPERLIAPASCE